MTDRELEVKFEEFAEGTLSPARTRTVIDAWRFVKTPRSAAELIASSMVEVRDEPCVQPPIRNANTLANALVFGAFARRL
jgi:hypothetical protein